MSSITTVQLFDQNFVYSFSEDITNYVGAVYSNRVNPAGEGATLSLLTRFGDTAENLAGYMSINTVSQWINRYNSAYRGISASRQVRSPNPAESNGEDCSGAASINCFNGATGELARHWWSVHNFLQYGGKCIVAGDSGLTWNYETSNVLMDKGKISDIDVAFALNHGEIQAGIIEDIVLGRNYDCFGVVGACGNLEGIGEQGQTAINVFPRGLSLDRYGMSVYGNKVHFGLNQAIETVTSPLIADAAGCLIRTDRDFYPWYPPAGFARGKLLNSIYVVDQPTDSSQNALLQKQVNFYVTVPSQGTFLLSDRTLVEDQDSPYKFINVSRLLIFLIKAIGPIAKRLLYEFNNEVTRISFVNSVQPILEQAQASGGLTDYTIVCDESNNTPAVIANNNFVADITIKSAVPITTINLRFTNLNT